MKSGAPEVRDNYQVLKEGDMSVWVPDAIDFEGDLVAVDLQGFLWMVNLVVTTAVPGSSSGGCAGCTSCG